MGIDAGAVIFAIERVTGSLAGLDEPEMRQTGWETILGYAMDLKFGTAVLLGTPTRVL